MGFIRFLIALCGALFSGILFIIIISRVMEDGLDLGESLALIAPAASFFILIGGVFGELLLKFKHFEIWWRGFCVYVSLGAIYGGAIVTLVSVTLSNPTEIFGWMWVIGMMVIASLVFYSIRTKMADK